MVGYVESLMLSLSQPGWTSLLLIDACDPSPVTVIHTPCDLLWPVSALAGAAVTRRPPITSAMTLGTTLIRLGTMSFLLLRMGPQPDGQGRMQVRLPFLQRPQQGQNCVVQRGIERPGNIVDKAVTARDNPTGAAGESGAT